MDTEVEETSPTQRPLAAFKAETLLLQASTAFLAITVSSFFGLAMLFLLHALCILWYITNALLCEPLHYNRITSSINNSSMKELLYQ